MEIKLAFQAATAQGVDLSAEQKKRLDGIAQRREASLQEYRKEGVTWTSVTLAQVEFEQRLTAALMLQQNLAAKEANVTPSPDAAVQARYEHALRKILGRLRGNGNITVTEAL